MKNIKKIALSILSIAGLLSMQQSIAGAAGLLKKTQGPGFEFYNKASQPVSIALIIKGTLTTADVPASGKYVKDVDLSDTIRLGVYNKKTTGISTAFMSDAITPQPDKVYELNAPGKTKYLSYAPAKTPALYPQTGTFMGLSGKSDSGYPLGSNLSQSQIVLKK